jgi:hypothetical protein
MRTLPSLVGSAAIIATLSLAQTAGATNTSLWIHGRTSGTPSGWTYWVNGSGANVAQGVGVNATPVNYNGTQHISVSNPTVVSSLNTYCKGSNSCYVQCHSAGCAQIGYAEAYNPGAWNIIFVFTGGSAAGGSELAGNTAYFFTGYDIDKDLAVSTMRAMYNHDVLGDDIAGYVYNSLGGDWASVTTCLFAGGCAGGGGQNDSAVSFQSAGHFRNSGTYGSDAAAGSTGGTWWDYSWAWSVDTSDKYGHCVKGAYPCQEGVAGGITSIVASAAAYNDH